MLHPSLVTFVIANALGLYMIAAGLGLLIDPERGTKLVDDLERSPGLMYLIAVVAFTVGALIILFHPYLFSVLSVIVTLIGLAALLEGLVLLIYPSIWFALARPFMRHLRIFAAVTIVFGAVLLFAGLTGHDYYL